MMPDKFTDDGDGWGFDEPTPPHAPADLLEAIVNARANGEDALAAMLAGLSSGLVSEEGNLTEKKVTVHRSDGTTYERTQKVGTGDDGDNLARAGEKPEAELHDEDRTAITSGIDKAAASLPQEARAEGGLLEKAKDVAITAAAKVYLALLKATPAMLKVGAVLSEVFDTPTDMAKLGYNPNTSSGTANPTTHDPVKNATADMFGVGVGGHLAITVAAQVLSRAAVWIKRKVSGKATEDDDDGISGWAKIIAALFASAAQSMGVSGAPDAGQVEQNLRGLLKARN